MKITSSLFLLLVTLLQVQARGVSQTLNYSAKNVKLEKLFTVITRQTGYVFFYHSQDIESAHPVNVKWKNQPLTTALEESLKDQQLAFDIQGKTIVISLKPNPIVAAVPTTPTAPPPPVTVHGKLVNQKGEPLPGVTITAKGGPMATTDDHGEFTLTNVDPNAQIVFSGINLETYETRLHGRTRLDLTLETRVSKLNEVVVVGYGTQQKVNLSGSVATVNYDQELENRPITDVSSALSGLASGLTVSQTTGQPGHTGSVLRIRGVGTLNNSDPLIIIDGVVGSLNNLNPDDVATVSILKDAASASIYGSRAANGVILVTTKRGRKGKTLVDYNAYAGVDRATHLFKPVTDYPTYMGLMNQINKADAPGNADLFKPTTIAAWQNATNRTLFPNTNWMDVMFGEGSITNHNLSVSGGNEKTNVYLSMGFLDDKGIIQTTNAKKYSLRINLDHKINDKLKVGGNISGYWNKVQEPFNVTTLIYYSANSTPGVTPKLVQEGEVRYGGRNTIDESNNVANPLQYIDTWFYPQTGEYAFGKLYGEWDIIRGLKLQVNGSSEIYNKESKQYKDAGPIQNLYNFQLDTITVNNASTPSTLLQRNDNSLYLTFYSTLTYNKDFGNHHLNLLAGTSDEYDYASDFTGQIQGFPSNDTWELGAGLSQPVVSGTSSTYSLSSYFGRADYNYKGKYILEANLRDDGSSRFAAGHRWGLFPSFSGAWRISEEDFFKNAGLTFVNNLKFRGSWGKLGNQNINLYQFLNLYSAGLNYIFGNTLSAGLAPTTMANPNITWESTTTTDLGTDLTLFDQKLDLTFDYYNRETNNILVQLPLSSLYGGVTPPYQNVGKVQNKGWEVSSTYKDHAGSFNWALGGNLSYNTNTVVHYQGNPNVIQATANNSIIKQGLPFNALYGYKADGTFKNQDDINKWAKQKLTGTNKPGDLKYEDINHDGIIDGNDRTFIGSVIPKYSFGFNGAIGYKGLVLSALFQGISGVSRYYSNLWYTTGIRPGREINSHFLNAWSTAHPNSNIPRLTTDNNSDNTQASSFWVQNGSFLRLKNLQLAYTVPLKWTQRAGITRLQVYANAQNPITWTKYNGLDPETGDYTDYQMENPNVRVLTFGLNLSF